MKKVVKKTKKSNKPEVFVDFTNNSSIERVYRALGIGKINAGMPIGKKEIDAIIDCAVDDFINYMFSWNNAILKNSNGKFVRLNLSVYDTSTQKKIDDASEQKPAKKTEKETIEKKDAVVKEETVKEPETEKTTVKKPAAKKPAAKKPAAKKPAVKKVPDAKKALDAKDPTEQKTHSVMI